MEWCGIKHLKGGLTPEQAQKIAAEVLPENGRALAKANALVALGNDYKKTLQGKQKEIKDLYKDVSAALGPDLTGQVSAELKSRVTNLTMETGNLVEASEAKRIFVLRLLSCVVCCVLCLLANFNAFEIAEAELGFKLTLLSGYPGQILTGFAASSGSSYWHDALDKIRAAKQSVGQMQKVISA